MDEKKEYGLVLSGGGTKGAFEIGVWKALQEMDTPISCVIGTSIGALNAALIAQNDFDAAYDFWTNLTINQVLKLNTTMVNKYLNHWSGASFDFFRLAFINDLFRGGLDISPLRENLSRLIDEDKIRKSPIRLGLVTVELNTLSPTQLMIEEIPQGKLLDYLLASAALPVFQRQEIDGKTYLDGGFYDNVPINFMASSGYKNIISVEFPAIGFKQRVDHNDIHLTVVENSEYLGMTLEFDQETIRNNIEMGDLDCKKTFGQLLGKYYYFNTASGTQFYEKLAEFMGSPLEDVNARQEVAMLLGIPENSKKDTIVMAIANVLRRTNYPKDEPPLLVLLEMAGRSLGVERMAAYTPDRFLLAILTALETLTRSNLAFIKRDDTIKKAFDADNNYRPGSLFDFISFYVLFVGSSKDLPIPTIRTLIKKFTPEFALSILLLIYLHQLLRKK